MEITSSNNDKIKYLVKLKEKKYRDKENLFLIEDMHLIKEALKNNLVNEIITTDNNEYDVKTYRVTDKIMKLLSSQVTSAKVIAVCKTIEERPIGDKLIILDNLQDPGNLGTIIRSAVAFNFTDIILSDTSVDLYNPKVIRASEGMIFNINVIRTNINDFLQNLDKSYLKVSTNVRSGTDIRSIKSKKIALVIGNEGNGVSKEINDLCDEFVYIKMNNNCESLNAGVSASILMYEIGRINE